MTSLSASDKLRRLQYQRIFTAFCTQNGHLTQAMLDIQMLDYKCLIYSNEVNIMMKPMNLFRMHEIAVSGDSEQFFTGIPTRSEPSRKRALFCQLPDDVLVQCFEFPRKVLHPIMVSAIFSKSL